MLLILFALKIQTFINRNTFYILEKGDKMENLKLPDLPEPDFPSISELPELEPRDPFGDSENSFRTKTFTKDSSLPSLPSGMQRSNFERLNFQEREFAKPIKAEPSRIEEYPRTIRPSLTREYPQQNMTRPNKAEPVFIRLDKFETGLETLEEIKEKISDIEEILEKTKELREKEDKELEEWEREIQIIKSKIEAVDRGVFSQLD